jgi:ABC-type antimicrobial peptide transport system permease subunit
VLAGALTVGYSVKRSLFELARARTGQAEYVLMSDGFFRESLGAVPIIVLDAVVTHDDNGRRVSRVAVYGVDGRFYAFNGPAVTPPKGAELLVSPALARELQAKAGDQLLLRVPRVSAIAAESLHGRKDDPGRTLRGRVREIAPRSAMGEFSLRPTQGDVFAIFVPLDRLQREFDLKGRANVALLSGSPDLKRDYQLEDVGLRLKGRMLEHESMLLNDALVRAALEVDGEASPVFTYLANVVRANGRDFPYSLIAAIDRPELKGDDEIVLNEWAAKELAAKTGDTVELEYYLWDPSSRLVTKTAFFRIAAIVPVDPVDRELAPEYPGISDAKSLSDWDPPFPMELKRIRPVDEQYWDRYRATPKAYIRLAAGQKLWRSRFGAVTSIRTTPSFSTAKLRDALYPTTAGLSVANVRQQNAAASAGATNFAEYFLYFSFFLIVSALLLAGLFFRLGVEQRAGQIASLRAFGFSASQVRSILVREALIVGLAGAVVGVIGALIYAALIVTALKTWWVDAVGTRDLSVYPSVAAMLAGFVAGVVMGPLTIFGVLRKLGRSAPRETKESSRTRARVAGIVCAIIGVALLAVGGAGGFFGAGTLLLAAGLFFFADKLQRAGSLTHSVRALGANYTKSRPGRSVLSAALIASATFLIVATDAFRRTGAGGEPKYRYIGESAIPVYHDPNSAAGREALNLPPDLSARWLPFRLRPGDDASCLNLYRPENPRVIGARPEYLKLAPTNDGTISAAADANSLTYVLHKKVGDLIEVGGAKLKIVEALHDSVFQSELIISDLDFQRSFPEEQGYRVFLIDAPPDAEPKIETALSDYGIDVTTTAARVAAYHRVENTYLSTFQMLGGLGLVLGTVGLATVLLRNVLERRRELGLLRAVGYTERHLTKMILAENLMLLAAGLSIGTVCALIAVAPTSIQRGGTPPWVSIALLLAGVGLTGIAASWMAVRGAMRQPFLQALRSE